MSPLCVSPRFRCLSVARTFPAFSDASLLSSSPSTVNGLETNGEHGKRAARAQERASEGGSASERILESKDATLEQTQRRARGSQMETGFQPGRTRAGGNAVRRITWARVHAARPSARFLGSGAQSSGRSPGPCLTRSNQGGRTITGCLPIDSHLLQSTSPTEAEHSFIQIP